MATRYVSVPRSGVPVVQAIDVISDPSYGSNIRLQADVVIVGSGAGGSVAAYELAKAGYDVLVLESGRYYPSTSFTEKLGDTINAVYRDQAGQINTTADVLFVEGTCLGGSTVIGGCVMQKAPDRDLRRWSDLHGLKALSPEKLAPKYEEVGRWQSVHANQPHEINSTAHQIIRGAEGMKYSWSPAMRNTKDCALTGHCLAGCLSDRKQSALVTTMPWAAAYGARIFTDTWVSRVLIRDGRAAGVEAVIRNPNNNALVSRLHVDAQVVVAAGGGIQTPLLLQRSQIPDYSKQLGKNLGCQPFTQMLGTFPKVLKGFRGALVGVIVDEFYPSKGAQFISGLAEPEQLMVQGSQYAGKDHIEFMMRYDRMAGLNAFVVDTGHGSVTWSGGLEEGNKEIHWNPSREEFEHIKLATSQAARIMFAGGADRVYLPTFMPLHCDSVFELDKTLAKVDYGINGLYGYRINSFSPQGTCRMALSRADGVTSEDGEVHDVPGLFVADASLFPEPLVSAPQWTVQVLAKHVAERIHARKDGLFIG